MIGIMFLWFYPLLLILVATFAMRWSVAPLAITLAGILLVVAASVALGSALRSLSGRVSHPAVLVAPVLAGPMVAGWAGVASTPFRVALAAWQDGRSSYYLLYLGTWIATLAYVMKVPWDQLTHWGRERLVARRRASVPAPDAAKDGAPAKAGQEPPGTAGAERGARLADLRIEEYRYYLEEQRQLWLSGKEWALTTVRLLLTANGGAVVAVLALVGALAKGGKFPFSVAAAGWGLAAFCAGVLLSTVAAGISTIYFSMLWRALPTTENVERRTTELLLEEAVTLEPFSRNHNLRAAAERYLIWSMASASLSAVCFVAGAGLVASAFFGGIAAT